MESGKKPIDDRPIQWIWKSIDLKETNSVESLYDRMPSQSDESLSVIYQPFDGNKKSHFADRGQILDFAISVGGGRILDFGPGDGWPSLLIAPMVEEVVGVDGSNLRVETCAKNAEKLEMDNVSFIHVKPGEPLPFEDESFDGVCAASSIEQTPDPRATLAEIFRVLKPGGKLRVHYESLSYYASSRQREMQFVGDESQISILVFERNVEKEYVQHYRLDLDMKKSEAENVFIQNAAKPSYFALTQHVLAEFRRHLLEATTWTTLHPSCATFVRWMQEAGFSTARPIHNGGDFAEQYFDRVDEDDRPFEMDDIDTFLFPFIEIITEMEASLTSVPGKWDPWITAVK